MWSVKHSVYFIFEFCLFLLTLFVFFFNNFFILCPFIRLTLAAAADSLSLD